MESYDIFYLPVQLICCIGILANSLLLIAFIKDPLKCFRNSATYLVWSLAISDSLFCAVMITIVARIIRPSTTQYSILIFLEDISVYSSILSVFSIALDRYLMIKYPLKHRVLMSGHKMAIWIASVWFLSSVHPVKKMFITSDLDSLVPPTACFILIISTALLYCKTFFLWRNRPNPW